MGLICAALFILASRAGAQVTAQSQAQTAAASTIPLWRFNASSTRDGNRYPGVMVRRNPMTNPGSSRIPVFVVPLVFKTHTVGVSFNSTTGFIGTQPGDTTFDPTVPDACYTAPNNIPIKMVAESPLLNPATFDFGGTFVGTTQYIDAFQRANFWQVLGSNGSGYHVLLDPVTILDPVVVDVPAI